ncbi:MAG TPA: hypothetical protein VIM88_02435 [Sulfurovum sp.]|uniref:hypothetical protein n=1 Tax=Sulfurovum sp. TaxID=1969726 RepID=UPI002F93C565
MRKKSMVLGLSLGLAISAASADDLKNSLTNILNKEEKPSIVNLDSVNLDGKAKPVQQVKKTRSSQAVIATVNGHNIIKKEADGYLKQRTQGKVTDFDHLPPEQRSRLVNELALPVVVADAAKKELTEEEKQVAYTRAWMQREARKIIISDEQAEEVYTQLKQQAQENNATQKIPPFESIKDKLKMQLIEKTLVDRVTKDVEIKVL